jgi:hypothetical protein
MQSKHRNRNLRSGSVSRRWCWKAALTCSLIIASPVLAANVPQASVDKIALNAHCSEAHQNAVLISDGNISYKQVADMASERSFVEHPTVYSGPAAWKTKIASLLDQYGDEPLSELCNENPSIERN